MNKRFWLFWLSTCIVFGLDRWTKAWAERTLTLGKNETGFAGWYNWELYHNPGAAGGLFSDHLPLLVVIAVLAVIGILWFVYRGKHDQNIWLHIGLGLMLGGALGNLFDRLLYQYVIDFINPVGANYIYNIADKGIHFGLYISLLGLFLSWLTQSRQQKRNSNNAAS